jgi:hypothetical protein
MVRSALHLRRSSSMLALRWRWTDDKVIVVSVPLMRRAAD